MHIHREADNTGDPSPSRRGPSGGRCAHANPLRRLLYILRVIYLSAPVRRRHASFFLADGRGCGRSYLWWCRGQDRGARAVNVVQKSIMSWDWGKSRSAIVLVVSWLEKQSSCTNEHLPVGGEFSVKNRAKRISSYRRRNIYFMQHCIATRKIFLITNIKIFKY